MDGMGISLLVVFPFMLHLRMHSNAHISRLGRSASAQSFSSRKQHHHQHRYHYQEQHQQQQSGIESEPAGVAPPASRPVGSALSPSPSATATSSPTSAESPQSADVIIQVIVIIQTASTFIILLMMARCPRVVLYIPEQYSFNPTSSLKRECLPPTV